MGVCIDGATANVPMFTGEAVTCKQKLDLKNKKTNKQTFVIKTECSFCITLLFTFHLPPDGCTLPIEHFLFLFLFLSRKIIFFESILKKKEERRNKGYTPTTFTSLVHNANDPIQGRTPLT